jgi:hypothetical protein
MHTDFACLLFSHLKRRAHPDTVRCIITDAIKIEPEFLTGMFCYCAFPFSCFNISFHRRAALWARRDERNTDVPVYRICR